MLVLETKSKKHLLVFVSTTWTYTYVCCAQCKCLFMCANDACIRCCGWKFVPSYVYISLHVLIIKQVNAIQLISSFPYHLIWGWLVQSSISLKIPEVKISPYSLRGLVWRGGRRLLLALRRVSSTGDFQRHKCLTTFKGSCWNGICLLCLWKSLGNSPFLVWEVKVFGVFLSYVRRGTMLFGVKHGVWKEYKTLVVLLMHLFPPLCPWIR